MLGYIGKLNVFVIVYIFYFPIYKTIKTVTKIDLNKNKNPEIPAF